MIALGIISIIFGGLAFSVLCASMLSSRISREEEAAELRAAFLALDARRRENGDFPLEQPDQALDQIPLGMA